ncbi:MAG: FAD/NAD(P)-binding protein [Candidatus Niyogibacteria bacterium]|nr:FAD/NAD(P)-binding protein [Candidatus Niyogibacteria bacterium]
MQNIYAPISVKIAKIEEHSPSVKLFRLKRTDGKKFSAQKNGLIFTPGQFVLAGVWGYGEAPFGPASDPLNRNHIDIVVRKIGQTTSALHHMKEGSKITLRGPYGNGYPIENFLGKDIIMITGGCGLPPIAALIEYIINNRAKFGIVHLLYGASTPPDLLMKNRMKFWQKNIQIMLTVDKPICNWEGRTGLISECLLELKINPANTMVAMCGPGPMVNALEHLLNPMGISDKRIFISMERKMQCGVGRCQHCVTGNKYVCADGPVFNLDEIDKNWD